MATQAGQIMMLGPFIFSINTASYDTLNRVDEWGWESQNRLLNVPAEQFTHYGSTTIDLDGVIYTLRGYYGSGSGTVAPNGAVVGTGQMEVVRQMANLRTPYQMVNGIGKNFGLFVIIKLVVEQSYILDDGQPRKQTFKIQLRSFGQDNKTGYFQPARQQVANNPLQNAGIDPIAGGTTGVISDPTTPPLLAQINNDLLKDGQPPSIATTIGGLIAQQDAKNGGQLGVPFIQVTPNTMQSILDQQAQNVQAAEAARIAALQQQQPTGFDAFLGSLGAIGGDF